MSRRSLRRRGPGAGDRPERGGGQSPFPGYRQLEMLATSALADVYRAVEVDTARPVALKVLKGARGGSRAPSVEAFNREIRALAALSTHPHIVTLFRTLTAGDGSPTLVLELCRESTADRLRASGPFPAFEVVAIGTKIAGALETAHRAGLLHRDVKPQNILTTTFGEPALADFGLAALHTAAQADDSFIGFTTLHAPPEALEGQPLSPASDVYGLASAMYQLLSGRPPFASYEGEAPAAVLLRILRDPPPRLTDAGVPLAVADLIDAALSKRAADRPSSAGEFAGALRAAAEGAGWPAPECLVLEPGDGRGWAPRSAPGAPAGPGGGAIDREEPAGRGGPAGLGQAPPRPAGLGQAPPRPAGLGQAPPRPAGPAAGGTAPPPAGRPPVQAPGVVVPAAGTRNVIAPRVVSPDAGDRSTPVAPAPPDVSAPAPPPGTAPVFQAPPAPALTPAGDPRPPYDRPVDDGRPPALPEPSPPVPPLPAAEDPYERTLTSTGLAATFKIRSGAQVAGTPPSRRLEVPWALVGAAGGLAVAVAVLVLVLVGVL
jgi:hypothetical protein